jgi:hypothetical protein
MVHGKSEKQSADAILDTSLTSQVRHTFQLVQSHLELARHEPGGDLAVQVVLQLPPRRHLRLPRGARHPPGLRAVSARCVPGRLWANSQKEEQEKERRRRGGEEEEKEV